MTRILLALLVLGTGAGAFHAAHNSTADFQHEQNAARETWLIETQSLAAAQSQQARLKAQIEDLKRILRQRPIVTENPVWAALQVNSTNGLSPELTERLHEEFGFNWTYSPDYVVVSREAVRHFGMQTVTKDGNLSDLATTVLAVTPEERSQVDAALHQLPAKFKEWGLANLERIEPQGDEVAHYTLPPVAALALSLSNSLSAAIEKVVGRERAEIIMLKGGNEQIKVVTGVAPESIRPDPSYSYNRPESLVVKRYVNNDGQAWLGVQMDDSGRLAPLGLGELSAYIYPETFRAAFPNGWADVAKREGFELPKGPPEK